uniref:Uncharacterized protein n=1 Tax=Rhizophora mucronata TaxID=61149 RepID=A0A2P2PQU8_RHIMU
MICVRNLICEGTGQPLSQNNLILRLTPTVKIRSRLYSMGHLIDFALQNHNDL